MDTIRAKVRYIIYEKDDFKIAKATVGDSLLFSDEITIKGVMDIHVDCEYEFVGEKKKDKYGESFVVTQSTILIPSDVDAIEAYLGSGLVPGISKKTARSIVKFFGADTLMVLDFSPDRLTEIPGIGKKKAKTITKGYKEQRAAQDIMMFLKEQGIGNAAAVKIYRQYGDESIAKIKANPYILADDINGIGFKKADAVALSLGYERTGHDRIKAGVIYTLSEATSSGHTFLPLDELISKASSSDILGVNEMFIEIEMDKLVQDGDVSREDDRIYLNGYLDAEKSVAEILREKAKKIDAPELDFDAIEKENNCTYAEGQKEAIRQALSHKVFVLTGGPGCVDCNTEYFNGKEWRKISRYKKGDKVLQYNMDGTAELVTPESYIKQPCNHMTLIRSKYGVNQCVSDEHRLVYESEKGSFFIKTTNEVKALHKSSGRGFRGRFFTSFSYNGRGIELTDAEIRLMCAVVCDGTFQSQFTNKNTCIINIKKQRKKERLEQLLNEAGISFQKYQHNPKDLDFVKYKFVAPRKEKSFGVEWYNCNKHQLEIFCDEICRWDGCFRGKRVTFSTVVKETADFVQFAYAATGRRARILVLDRSGLPRFAPGKIYIRKSIEYEVTISNVTKISIHNRKTKDNMSDVVPEDGFKYCFTVPSGMLVLRREGCINITGNSGKTTTTRAIISALEKNGEKVFLVAPTGRAAKRMSEVTGRSASTIHRLLDYNPTSGWGHNKDNPLQCDTLIVDECSMVGILLMRRLLEGVCESARIILVGDKDQLPSVEAGCVLKDILESDIPSVCLTEIFRQAQDSNIVMNAHDVNEGVKPTRTGNDFFIALRPEREDIQKEIIRLVTECMKRGYERDEVQVLSPMRRAGDPIAASELNKILQNTLNPEGVSLTRGFTTFREGDRVMQMRNNYDKNVFNGDTGIIKSIDTEEDTMDIEMNGETLTYERKEFDELELAYASTIHKSQGSEYPVVIIPMHESHYIMLERNLLYTAITRAKKICILVGTQKAISMACSKQTVLDRHSYLAERLSN